jgi:hypothetical protein
MSSNSTCCEQRNRERLEEYRNTLPFKAKNHLKTPNFPIANLEFPCYLFSLFRLEGGSRSMIAKLFLISKRVNMAGPTRLNRWSQP